MPTQEVLLLAMTKMRSGICVAGLTPEPDPVTGLRWVRPTRDFDTVQPGDMADAHGRLFQCSDVVELNLLAPQPDPPHVEDWLTDFVHRRPRLLRRLEGERRARFFNRYLDRAPEDVLIHHTRSLCLVQPQQVWARFSLDAYSGKYQARMGFVLTHSTHGSESSGTLRPDKSAGAHPHAPSWHADQRGISVTDLKWRALGRSWLGEKGGHVTLRDDDLYRRLGAEALYLALGLSRTWQGQYWPLVVGVHVVPDYEATIDWGNL